MLRWIRSKHRGKKVEDECKNTTSTTGSENNTEDNKGVSLGEHRDDENGSNDVKNTNLGQSSLPLVVAAIDFGTTYTGYAFSFQHDYKTIYTSQHGGKLIADRVPTTILLNPDRTFHSFGYNAEEHYADLTETCEHKDWFYFKEFKMAMYLQTPLTRETMIYDSQGRPMKAIEVISMAIKHMRELAEEIICQSKNDIIQSDIKWIITIPAIWSDSARQFMRETATNAGIVWSNLHLVMEPEAASLFCKEQPSQKVIGRCERTSQLVRFPSGFKYILADLGGGTADICVHQIIEGGNIREIYRTTGDALGGTNVDFEFRQFLIKLFGADALMEFKSECLGDYQELMEDFQKKKCAFSSKTVKITCKIPTSFVGIIENKRETSISHLITESTVESDVEFKPRQNKLILQRTLMEQFFKPSAEGITKLMMEIIRETRDTDLSTVLLVGGYSESPYLREIMQSEMKDLSVVLEPEAKLAVLKGAVLMGYEPRSIVERRAQFTYGFSIRKRFQEGLDPEELKLEFNGKVYCNGIFHKQIYKGQLLTYGQCFNYKSISNMQNEDSKHTVYAEYLFKSSMENPSYCREEEECKQVGEILIEPPTGGWPDMVQFETSLIVGETEFDVKVSDKSTGVEYEAKMEFL